MNEDFQGGTLAHILEAFEWHCTFSHWSRFTEGMMAITEAGLQCAVFGLLFITLASWWTGAELHSVRLHFERMDRFPCN